MNILFLISSLLLIFACLHTKLLNDNFLLPIERRSLHSYNTAKIALHNKWENRKYALYKKNQNSSPIQKKPKAIKKTENTFTQSYFSHRQKKPLPVLAKWNLSPLLLASHKNTQLENSVELLLQDLYGHTDFWQQAQITDPDFAHNLISSFYQKDGSCMQLSDLFPKEPALQFPFYKMLKGSGSYDIIKKTGHPPLKEFFHLNHSDEKTLNFTYASYPALKAFFGTLIAQEILKKEEEKKGSNSHLNETELNALLMTRGKGIEFPDLKFFFLFSGKKESLEQLSYHDKNGVYLQIPIPH